MQDGSMRLYNERKQRLSTIISDTIGISENLDLTDAVNNLSILKNKLDSSVFRVMVVGTFKNGKSTFINAMLGRYVLPSYATPATAIISEVKYGTQKRAVLYFANPLPEKLHSSIPSDIKSYINRNNGKNIPPMEIPYDSLEDYATIPMEVDVPEELFVAWRKDSVRQIKNYVNDGELRRRCRMEAHDMTDRLDEATGTVKECFMQELRNFQSEFQKKFRGLNLLDVSFAPKSVTIVAPSSISPVDLDSASRNISSTLDEGVISAGLGAAGGAALGFALGGPVGGLLGGLFGAAAGSACDMDAVKKDVWREMSSDVSRFFSDVIDECSSSLDSCVYDSKNRLSREIDNYYSEYRQCVDNRVAQWNSKKASVEQQIADINADIVALDKNRNAVNSIVARMKAE